MGRLINLENVERELKEKILRCYEHLDVTKSGNKIAIHKKGINWENSIHISIWETKKLSEHGETKAFVISIDGGRNRNEDNLQKLRERFPDLVEIGNTGYFYAMLPNFEEFLCDILTTLTKLICKTIIKGLL